MARDDERDEGLEHTGYRSGQVRIVGAEPAGRSAARAPTRTSRGLGARSRRRGRRGRASAPTFVPAPAALDRARHRRGPRDPRPRARLGRRRPLRLAAAGRPGARRAPTGRPRTRSSSRRCWPATRPARARSTRARRTASRGCSICPGPSPTGGEIFGDDEPGTRTAESGLGRPRARPSPPAWVSDDEDDGPITAVILPVVGAERR